jgi:hypothetical protein
MMHFENPGPSLNFRKGWKAVIRSSRLNGRTDSHKLALANDNKHAIFYAA